MGHPALVAFISIFEESFSFQSYFLFISKVSLGWDMAAFFSYIIVITNHRKGIFGQ
jgi:hypothetical protein